MADTPSWRQGYDVVERQVGPRLEQLMRSEQFAVAVGLMARVQRTVEAESGRMTRRVLHRLNLPAGTDVSRILNEIGQLRRQVHDLTVELEDAKTEVATTPTTRTPASARTPRAATKKATATTKLATTAKQATKKATATRKLPTTSTTPKGASRGRAPRT